MVHGLAERADQVDRQGVAALDEEPEEVAARPDAVLGDGDSVGSEVRLQDVDDATLAIVADVVDAFRRDLERDEHGGRSPVTQGPVEAGGVVDEDVVADQGLQFFSRKPLDECSKTATSRTPKEIVMGRFNR